MSETYNPESALQGELNFTPDDFAISSVEDEIRVDGHCRTLMMNFYHTLLENGLSPTEATALANGADYFVRDFVVGYLHANLLEHKPGIVRKFAANWYIVNTLEPDTGEIAGYLAGVGAFYRFVRDIGLISADFYDVLEQECVDIPYYDKRIESFWAISGDGYGAWERECSLKGQN